jgi:hypothetical protein
MVAGSLPGSGNCEKSEVGMNTCRPLSGFGKGVNVNEMGKRAHSLHQLVFAKSPRSSQKPHFY